MVEKNPLVMGFDFGQTKIGVAIGQRMTATATPLGIISARDGKPDWDQLDGLVSEWQPETLVVGLPLNMDDSMSEMGEAAAKFSRRLHGRYSIETYLMDERLSTFEARLESDNEKIDDVAAKIILESWLRDQ